MSYYGTHPSLQRETEPVDPAVWHWFVCNGPHGEKFTWQRDPHPGSKNIDLLRRFMAEKEEARPGFMEKARLTALEAISSPDPILVMKAIHVLTVAGNSNDFKEISALISHADERVSKHARSSLFELGIKVKRA